MSERAPQERCPCGKPSTHIVYDELGAFNTNRCTKCAEEMVPLGWKIHCVNEEPK